jgi:hypothetical protein
VRGEANGRLNCDESERQPDEECVAPCAALVDIDEPGNEGSRRDSAGESTQPQTRIEGAERQEAFAQKAWQSREQDAAEGRLRQVAWVSFRKLFSCC